jgi:hypothetical protein
MKKVWIVILVLLAMTVGVYFWNEFIYLLQQMIIGGGLWCCVSLSVLAIILIAKMLLR